MDFILRDINMDYSYVQVARYIDNGNVDENGINLTEEREYRPLEQIRDSFPKYVMTLDRLLQKEMGFFTRISFPLLKRRAVLKHK